MEPEETGVSRTEFEEHKKRLNATLSDIRTQLGKYATQQKEYACAGCTFETDNLGEFTQHVIRESVENLRTSPSPPKRHSFTEYLKCEKCRPEAEKRLKAMGWRPPKEKSKSGIDLP